MCIDPISIPFMFFIENFIASLYGRVYNIDIFIINNLLILIYFAIHYHSFINTINNHKTNIVYKKYKGLLILHIIFNYIISLGLTTWFIKFIYYDNDILWNILFAPFISVTLSTAFDSRILRKIEKRVYSELREKEYQSYKNSLIKIVEAQDIQQKILSIHNKELGELRKNISIVEEMIHFDENTEENENKNKEAQGNELP